MRDSRLVALLSRHTAWLFALVLALAYLPSLSPNFLNWDDPWLIVHNPLLVQPSVHALGAMWTDFSRDTRLALGAEYLPLRDTSLWIEAHLWGLHALPMRLTNLAIYIGAALFMRAALLRTLESRLAAEGAAWLFALHPVHVESAAWLAGRKDVLALLFVAAALREHAGTAARRVWLVPLLLLAAELSKAVSVTAIALLLAQDLLARRRFDIRLYAGVAAVAAAGAATVLLVGQRVAMIQPLIGGSRLATAATMGPVWLRYLALSFVPVHLSLVHDVPIRTAWTATGVLGYAVLVAWAAVGVWQQRRGRPLAAASFLWFVAPLVPVSQVLFPLQNLMADRYLLLSVMGPCLLLAVGAARNPRVGAPALGVAAALLSGVTAERASLFADSVDAFLDATQKTGSTLIAPYQLAYALEERGDYPNAIRYYREVLRRMREPEETGRRATNNLARALVRHKHLHEAELVLERGRKLWPDDPKMLGNLAKVLAREGEQERARRLVEELRQRFPRYLAR